MTRYEQEMALGHATAHTLRRIAKAEGLEHLIEKVSSGRKRTSYTQTYVGLKWAAVRNDDDDKAQATQLAEAFNRVFAQYGHDLGAEAYYRAGIAMNRYHR